ncbi:MAG: hypothetical protein ACO1O3_08530 [Sphingobium sp.]
MSSASTIIPAAPAGWFDHDWFLLSDGALAVLRTDRDIRAAHAAWWRRTQSGEDAGPYRDPSIGAAAKLFVLARDGSWEKNPVAIDLPEFAYPEIDRFGDGRWVVVSARAGARDVNARILAPDGQMLHGFAAGDGIEHIRCAPDGTIWIGYFDEGIFGDTLAQGGLVRFDPRGKPLWSYNDESRGAAASIADCYALTLDGDALWACFYTDFPIVRIADGKESLWHGSASGVRALAMDGDHVLLAGGYGREQSRLTLVRLSGAKLSGGTAQTIGTLDFDSLDDAALVQGRGDTIHVVKGDRWHRITVGGIRAELNR